MVLYYPLPGKFFETGDDGGRINECFGFDDGKSGSVVICMVELWRPRCTEVSVFRNF